MNKKTKVILVGFFLWGILTYIDYLIFPHVFIWLSLLHAGLLMFVGVYQHKKNASNNTDHQSS